MTVFDDAGGAIIMEQSAEVSAALAQLVRPAPTAPYEIVGAYRINALSATGADGGFYGPHFRLSTIDETINWRHRPFIAGTSRYRVDHYDSDVFQSGINSFVRFEPSPTGIVWFKLVDDNVNLEMWYSNDGVHWVQTFTQARATQLGAAPDQVGMTINNISSQIGFVQLLAWQE
jgi:hypothetical protein